MLTVVLTCAPGSLSTPCMKARYTGYKRVHKNVCGHSLLVKKKEKCQSWEGLGMRFNFHPRLKPNSWKEGNTGMRGEEACQLTLAGQNSHYSTPFPLKARLCSYFFLPWWRLEHSVEMSASSFPSSSWYQITFSLSIYAAIDCEQIDH